ncbi:MAG TPA: peptidylprolyl isomerase [Virgibacillus sp.]|nr:peptidylprolyl isomerase [Virgibacillus sp.]
MDKFLTYKRMTVLVMTMLLAVFLVGCGAQPEEDEETKSGEQVTSEASDDQKVYDGDNPVVTITMENDDEIVIELYPTIAPNTVDNFISLIDQEFYDGLIFHRVIQDFMIQGGDPDGNGTGGPGYAIKGEFSSNEFENSLSHNRGVLAMARSGDPDSAGSQFFIVVENAEHLDGDYASFGEVTDGMDVVDEIASVDVSTKKGSEDKPLEDQKIKTIRVDTKDYDAEEPKIQ